MFRILLAVALFVSCTYATSYQTCSDGPEPLEVRLVGCEVEPCVFHHGDTVNAQVDFSVSHNVAKLRPDVLASVFGVSVPYPLPEQNACNSLVNSACPLIAGDIATYQLLMPISSVIPAIDLVNVQLSVVDNDTDEKLVCFSVDLTVTD
ncbi:hypothetical protein C0J52_22057 [Blattella germanica]|nr:hypothetical protein C0J52_22057 [Blattella germanica]